MAISRQAIVAIMAILLKLAIMAWVNMATNQCSARPLILFKTKTKTCLDFNFLSRPIPRLVLISIFFQDQYQDKSWNGYFFETNTKTSLDIGNNSRPIPRVLIIDMFETNTNTNTTKFNPIDIEDHKGEHKNFYGTFYNKLLGLCHLQNLCLEKAPQEFGVHHCHLLD